MISDILRITETPVIDDTITQYEEREYEPKARTGLNSAGETGIDNELQDLFSHPSESYLLFEGQLQKTDGTAYANADVIALTNNGLTFLFSQISYYLSNQEIETVYNPGQATTMLGLLKYSEGYVKAQELNMCWAKDSSTAAAIDPATSATYNTGLAARQSYMIQQPTIKGKFSFIVPSNIYLDFAKIMIKLFMV